MKERANAIRDQCAVRTRAVHETETIDEFRLYYDLEGSSTSDKVQILLTARPKLTEHEIRWLHTPRCMTCWPILGPAET